MVLFRAVNVLKLRSATEDDALLKARGVLCEKRNQRTESLPLKEVPLSFASRRWWDLLRHPTDPQKIDRRQLEICVLSCLADPLQAGTVYAPGSDAYADHREKLLLWPECESRLKKYCDRLNLPASPDKFVDQLQRKRQRRQTGWIGSSLTTPPSE